MARHPSDRHFLLLNFLLYMPRTMEELEEYFGVTSRSIYRWIEDVYFLFDISYQEQFIVKLDAKHDFTFRHH